MAVMFLFLPLSFLFHFFFVLVVAVGVARRLVFALVVLPPLVGIGFAVPGVVPAPSLSVVMRPPVVIAVAHVLAGVGMMLAVFSKVAMLPAPLGASEILGMVVPIAPVLRVLVHPLVPRMRRIVALPAIQTV